MKIVIINSGSSSIKYQLINMPANEVICSGMIDRIGLETSNLTYVTATTKLEETLPIANHKIGLEKIAQLLMDEKLGVIKSTDEIEAVGHVVHGGSAFSNTVIITSEVKDKIRQLFDLAPLHNPANLEGINVAEEIFSSAKQVAVFDTAFHQTIPVVAHKYAVPNYLLTENKIRVYGFHGTSHKYVSENAIHYLEQNSKNKGSKIITIHLGNGCSMTAIKDGKSIDHTLGFGPMNGLIMGTRSGDVDQSVIFYLVNTLGYSLEAVNTMLQKQSGMLGLTGYSDLRDIEANAENGNADCQFALAMNAYRIKKYIGSYAAVLNGLDAIVFTAGIGENSTYIRKLVCTDMEYFGIELDASKNEIRSKAIREINTDDSKTKILVIPTNEEIEIANQVFELLTNA
jgi:acetate kinase